MVQTIYMKLLPINLLPIINTFDLKDIHIADRELEMNIQ